MSRSDFRGDREIQRDLEKARERARCRAVLEVRSNPHVSLPITDKSMVRTDVRLARCVLKMLPEHDLHKTFTPDGREHWFQK